MRRSLLGQEHPYVTRTLAGLADLHRDKGDFEAAESLYQTVLSRRQNQHGEEHAEVARSLGDLARLMHHKGDLTQAETLFVQALEMSLHP